MTEYMPAAPEFIVNTITFANQIAPNVTRLASGGFLVVWQTNDSTQDGNGGAIKGQIFDAAGLKVGSEFLVNSAVVGGQQGVTSTSLANGNFVVTWDTSDPLQDGSGFAVKAQIFSGTGIKIGSEFLVNISASGDQSGAEITGLANGGFVITWFDWGTDFEQRAQVFSAQGVKVGSEILVNTASAGLEEQGEVIGLANGTFLVTWRTSLPLDGNSGSVMGRIFDPNGTPVGAQFVVNSQASGTQDMPTGTALSNGNFVIAWRTADTTQDGSSTAIKAQMFSVLGVKIGGEFLVNTQGVSSQGEPTVSELPGGGFIVAWKTSDITQDGAGTAIKAQVFDANGAKEGAEFLVNGFKSGDQSLPNIATLNDGRIVMTWNSVGADGNGTAISARTFSAVTPPTITSEGGGTAATLSVPENGTDVTTVTASGGQPGSTLHYSIAGGADAALFSIDINSGALRFIAAPDFEQPADTDHDGLYQVVVAVSDTVSTDTQQLTINVANVNEAPVITSNGAGSSASLSINENSWVVTTVSGSDPEGTPLVYSIDGGEDASQFLINPQTGLLSFYSSYPDYETPTDSNHDNVYVVSVRASDGTKSDSQLISVTVLNVNESARFVSNGGAVNVSITVAENVNFVQTVLAVDPEGGMITYAIAGGADNARFTINAQTGVLQFIGAPNFEAPTDSNSDNIYQVAVGATESYGTRLQYFNITVGNVNEAPNISSNGGGSTAAISVQESNTAVTTVTSTDPDGSPRSYSISGGADAARFTIDAQTGVLSFVSAPNYEAPADSNGDNVHQVTVSASDGSLVDTQALTVTVTNVNESPLIVSAAANAASENSNAAGTVAASDPDGTTPSYAIVGGADAPKLTIDAATGALSFVSAPNYEAPADFNADNVYEVTVQASDGSLSATQAVTVSVNNVNEAPTITSSASMSAAENGIAVGSIVASDPDGAAVTYSITGGGDAARFTINAQTGALSFISAPDYEAPSDNNVDNVYQVIVSANDGSLTADKTVSVQVTNVDEAPVFTSFSGGSVASVSVAENSIFAGTLSAADPEGSAVTFAIVGGSDAARFTLSGGSTVIVFVNPANFEAPGDANADNIYDIVLRATDSTGHSSLQSLAITITNADEAPVFTSFGGASQGNVTISENSTTVATLSAVDPEGTAPVYSIWNGADMAKFTINSATGALSLINTPNFEIPTDSNSDNVYNVVVAVTSGGKMAFQTISVTVGNVNEAPTITSNGGGDTASITTNENAQTVTTLASTDPEGTARTYSISGGLDASRFAINASTGALSFIAAPNYEAPGDSNGDNVYQVVVAASDGSLSDSQTISISVGNVNEAPSFASSASQSALENATAAGSVAASDPDGTALIYSIVGGADAAKLTINAATGALSFVNAPNYEGPGDADGNNAYEVTVRASDGSLTTIQAVTVSVGNVNEAPVITSQTIYSVAENATAVGTVAASDPDGTAATYSISGGADAAKFAIDAVTGALSFVAAPDFETLGDADGNNAYEVTVQASDGSLSETRNLTVTVTNVNEAPVISSGASFVAPENGTAVGTVMASDVDGPAAVFAIVGGADAAKFTVNASTGALSFVSAPNFEAPADSNGDNVYQVVVSASDGSLSDTQAISVSVGNDNEAPSFTSSANQSALENVTAAGSVVASDPEGDALTYTIVGGADAAKFAIDAQTGALSFIAALNYETPGDADGNNAYEVTVRASDGSLTTIQAVTVSVGNVNEAPIITSQTVFSVNENTSAVTTLASIDPEGTARTYSIGGGTDAAKFTINAATGALSFVAAPNYEAPTDSNGDNVYQVVVVASDGSLTDSQTISVTVGNVNEAPVITSNGGGDTASITVNENTSAVTTLASIDPEGTARTYSIGGGTDAAKFTINAATGALSFVAAPNYEAPTDSNGDNVYQVVVVASDGSLTDSQTISVTVGNVIDGLTLTGTNKADTLTGGVAEDTISGLGGNDTLSGGGGSDTIDGGDGNDVLTGGAGADRLTGGAGADTFVYQALGDSSQATMDFLTDFSIAQNDKISLSAIDANTGLTGDQAFNWIGSGAFSNVAGQLRYYQSGGDTFVTGDVNGDGVGDFLIQIDPLVTLAATNFVL